LDYVILGVVQGLTEFFPVSSDGHLVLAEYFLGFHQSSLFYDVMLHFGTLGSLVVVYRKEVLALVKDTLSLVKKAFEVGPYKAFLGSDSWTRYVWVTTFVTGIVGLLAEGFVESISTSTMAAGIGFLITASVLFVANWRGKSSSFLVREMPWHFPIWIGLAQGLALLPGVSRSGSTICLALLLGARRDEAGKFSFVAAIPIIFLATLYEFRKAFTEQVDNWPAIGLGVLASFVVGFLAIRLLILMLTRLALWPFAVYTLGAAIVSFLAALDSKALSILTQR
jgi:undecaprenyl-diphosphatase